MAAAIVGAYLLIIVVGTVAASVAKGLSERVDALESSRPSGPDAKCLDDIRSLVEKVRTLGIELGKVTPMGAHSDLCDRVGRLERGLQDMADQWTEPPWGGPPTIPENDPE